MTRSEAAQELLDRRMARANLVPFFEYVNPTFETAEHHKKIAAAFERVEQGLVDLLIINVPPRHTKTELLTKAGTAWYLGRHPERQVITCSYSDELAQEYGRHTRNRIGSQDYKNIFPGVSLRQDSQAANRWHTNAGGIFISSGIGGGLTGRGAHCLLADTEIITRGGVRHISDIDISTTSCYTLAYENNKTRWAKVEAISSRKADGYYRITTAKGAVVEATGEHPFLTGRGWIKAGALASGDSLVRVLQKNIHKTSLHNGQEVKKRIFTHLLFPGLRIPELQQSIQVAFKYLSLVWKIINKKIMFFGMQEVILCSQGGERSQYATPSSLSSMQCDFSEKIISSNILWSSLCKQGTRLQDDGYRQPRVEKRNESSTQTTPWSQGVQGDKGGDIKKRSSGMCGVRQPRESTHTPYQYESIRQPKLQPDNPLQVLPHEISCRGTFQTEEDIVVMVERVRKPTVVYNLQVEGTENYFANGILVHNCGIVDDPHKDWAEAKSPTIRKHIEDWWDTVFTTRMMPPPTGAIVLIMTRWDLHDLTWYALETTRGTGWRVEHIVMPAIDKKGNALWPGKDNKWWPTSVLNAMPIKKVNEKWLALYQQDPIENQHSKMQRGWFEIVDTLPADCDPGVRAWDVAATEPEKGKDPDWTSGLRMRHSKAKGKYYIADIVHFQGTPKAVDDTMLNTARLDNRPVTIWEEQEPGSSGKAVVAKRTELLAGFDYRSEKPVTNKEVRANPFASQAEAGNVCLLRGPWNEAFLQEVEQFPNGEHDDQVDSASLAFEKMTGISAFFEVTKQQYEAAKARRR